MKTKIGLPFGLALVAFIGVFTTMLALGALNPNSAHAAPDPSTLTFEVNDLTALMSDPAPAKMRIAFTNDSTAISDLSMVFTGMDLADAAGGALSLMTNWTVKVEETDGTATELVITQVTVSNTLPKTITLASADTAVPAGADVEVIFATHIPDSGLFILESSSTEPTVTIEGVTPAVATENTDIVSTITTITTTPVVPLGDPVEDLEVTATTDIPGEAAGYTFKFPSGSRLVANQGTITLYFDKDFEGTDGLLSKSNVTVSAVYKVDADGVRDANGTFEKATGAFNPSTDPSRRVLAVGKHGKSPSYNLNNVEYTITVPDMNGDADGVDNIEPDSVVTVHVSPAAGITLPTEASPIDDAGEGGKGPIGVFTSEQTLLVSRNLPVKLAIGLSSYASNRNKSLTIIGKGFKNDTTVSVYVSHNEQDPRLLATDTSLDTSLGSDVLVGSDDTFTHTVNVTVPPFDPGVGNWIYATDGKADPNTSSKLGFEVEGLVVLSPTSAAIGDEVDITLEDWGSTSEIISENVSTSTTVAGVTTTTKHLESAVTIAGVPQKIVSGARSANFRIEISTATPSGTNQLVVDSRERDDNDEVVSGGYGENDTVNITISGANLRADVTTVVPNQVITLTGHGFTGRAKISTDETGDRSEIRVGNSDLELLTGTRNFNGGREVVISSGGTWSASLIIPITPATTSAGTHTVEVTDDGNRSGSFEITIPERTLSIEPDLARPGEWVTLTGSGFPSDNSRSKEQSTPSVSIEYDGNDVGTARPDSSGNIVLRFVVPRDAAIPSTNRVEAQYNYENGNAPVRASIIHEVPGARITLGASEGSPGDSLTVTGDGFKSFTSIDYVKIGGIDVTPAPKPATNRDGELTANILVPDLAPGANSVEISVGDDTDSHATANANFKIVEESATPITMMMEAEAAAPDVAFAPVIAEDNLVKVFHFDPATQNEAPNYGWTIYDARPLFMKTNTLSTITPGGFYFLQVENDQMGVEIGGRTMDLYAGLTPVQW